MAQFKGFSTSNKSTLQRDVDKAKALARRCASVLTYAPNGYSKHVSEVLKDTFGIDGADRSRVAPIQDRFANFPSRIDNTDFVFDAATTPSGTHIGHVAYVKTSILEAPRFIYVLPAYFQIADPVERASALIHEYIHLINRAADVYGHPGNGGQERQIANFGRGTIGIEWGYAYYNAYCYEYFAQWL